MLALPVQFVPTVAGLDVGANVVLIDVAPILRALTTASRLTPKILQAASGMLVEVNAMLSEGRVASTGTPSPRAAATVIEPPHGFETVAPAVPMPVTRLFGKNPKFAKLENPLFKYSNLIRLKI